MGPDSGAIIHKRIFQEMKQLANTSLVPTSGGITKTKALSLLCFACYCRNMFRQLQFVTKVSSKYLPQWRADQGLVMSQKLKYVLSLVLRNFKRKGDIF